MNKLFIEEMENAGCNNGNYPAYRIEDENGNVIQSGITCNCHRGCANTDDVYGAEMAGFKCIDE